MSDTNPPTAPRRRWVMPLLFVSLALNLLVVGAVVGRSLSPDAPHKRERVDGPIRSVIGEPFVRALGREDRRAMLDDLRREAPKIRETREDLRGRFIAFLEALRADPFDPTAVEQLLQDQSEVARGRQELGRMLMVNRLNEMSADERAAYADRLERDLKKLKRR